MTFDVLRSICFTRLTYTDLVNHKKFNVTSSTRSPTLRQLAQRLDVFVGLSVYIQTIEKRSEFHDFMLSALFVDLSEDEIGQIWQWWKAARPIERYQEKCGLRVFRDALRFLGVCYRHLLRTNLPLHPSTTDAGFYGFIVDVASLFECLAPDVFPVGPVSESLDCSPCQKHFKTGSTPCIHFRTWNTPPNPADVFGHVCCFTTTTMTIGKVPSSTSLASSASSSSSALSSLTASQQCALSRPRYLWEGTCVICDDILDFSSTQPWSKKQELRCGHRFHQTCLRLWHKHIKQTKWCPICCLYSSYYSYVGFLSRYDEYDPEVWRQSLVHELSPRPLMATNTRPGRPT